MTFWHCYISQMSVLTTSYESADCVHNGRRKATVPRCLSARLSVCCLPVVSFFLRLMRLLISSAPTRTTYIAYVLASLSEGRYTCIWKHRSLPVYLTPSKTCQFSRPTYFTASQRKDLDGNYGKQCPVIFDRNCQLEINQSQAALFPHLIQLHYLAERWLLPTRRNASAGTSCGPVCLSVCLSVCHS